MLENTSGQGLSEGSGWLKPSLWVGGPRAHPMLPHATPFWGLHPGPASGCLCALSSCDLPVSVPQPLVCDDPHTSLTLGAVLSLVSACLHGLFPLSGILCLFASKFPTLLYFMEMLWLHFCYFKTLCVFSLFWFWVSFLFLFVRLFVVLAALQHAGSSPTRDRSCTCCCGSMEF